jgi:hypothetical protein
MKYKISYSGWTTVEIEAESPSDAIGKFWDEGHNDLYDAVIDCDPEPVGGTK